LPPPHITKIIPYVFRIMSRTRRVGDGWCEPFPDGRQRWREDAIEQLLAIEDADVLFVAGCEENQVRFHPRFDVIILPSAPAEVLVERLTSRMGIHTATPPANSSESSMTLRPSGRCCVRQPIMRSGPRRRSATWSRWCCV
jgi:hypothetical protein